MSFVFGPLGILLVCNVFATSGMQTSSGKKGKKTTATTQATVSPTTRTLTTTTGPQQTDTTGFRTIYVTTLPTYDYYMSLSRFRICLKRVENMTLTFYVKSCHGGRVGLLTEKGFDGPMYEIVFDNNHSYIQEKKPGGQITNKTDKISLGCDGFSKFWMSWGNNNITLGNTNQRLRMGIRNGIDLLHATVTSWLGTSGAEWKFVFRDSGMLRPVILKNETLMLCPLVEECSLKTSTCNPIISAIDIVCNDSKVYMNFKCNTDYIEQACTTEIIQITECVSTRQQGCKTCHVTNVAFDAASLCPTKTNHIKVIDVHACNFIEEYDWKSYFRYVHFKSEQVVTTTPASAITTEESIEKTMAMALTTTPMTTTPTANTPPATTTVKSTTINKFAESQQKPNTPLTIGIAVGATGLLLAVICAVILLLFIKRSRIAEHKQSSAIIVSKGDDYTGNQSIALPSGGHIPNSEKYTDIQLEIEEQNYQELTTISKSENEVAYDYIDTSDVKRKSAPKADKGSQKPEYVKQAEDLPDYPPTTDGNNYSVLDPDETGFNRSRELPKIETETDASSAYAVLDPTVTGFHRSAIPPVQPVETYAILDPRETGFNRLEKAVTSHYAMAKPLTDDKIGKISEQPYCSDYNELGDSVLKKVEENVYSHSVDNVYDCASHNSKSKGSDGTYDHFVGQ